MFASLPSTQTALLDQIVLEDVSAAIKGERELDQLLLAVQQRCRRANDPALRSAIIDERMLRAAVTRLERAGMVQQTFGRRGHMVYLAATLRLQA